MNQRIEDIDDRNNTRTNRYILPSQSQGVATAIPFFVMAHTNLSGHLYQPGTRIRQDSPTNFGVKFHNLEFAFGELSRFLQYVIGDADLSYVVHRRGNTYFLGVGIAPTQVLCHEFAVQAQAADMRPGFTIIATIRGTHQTQGYFLFPRPDFSGLLPHRFLQNILHQHALAANLQKVVV